MSSDVTELKLIITAARYMLSVKEQLDQLKVDLGKREQEYFVLHREMLADLERESLHESLDDKELWAMLREFLPVFRAACV